jgi:hypothetical protein
MTEPERVTHVRGGSESRGKGKTKAVIKRSKTEAPTTPPEQVAEGRPSQSTAEPRSSELQARDPEVIARIQQRAYGLFVAGGCEHGHALEHWLEAERQITGSPER